MARAKKHSSEITNPTHVTTENSAEVLTAELPIKGMLTSFGVAELDDGRFACVEIKTFKGEVKSIEVKGQCEMEFDFAANTLLKELAWRGVR